MIARGRSAIQVKPVTLSLIMGTRTPFESVIAGLFQLKTNSKPNDSAYPVENSGNGNVGIFKT